MAIQLYDPFQKFDFSPQTCFLTGKNVHSTEEQISVFPEWIMDRYSLRDKTFKVLDESSVRYQDMKIPCFSDVIQNDCKTLWKKK